MDSNDVIEVGEDSDAEMEPSTPQPSTSKRRLKNQSIDGEKCSVMETSKKEPKTSKHLIGNQTIEEFTKDGMALIVEATKCTNAFPSGVSRSLYSVHPTFNKIVEQQSNKMFSIISKVIKLQNIKGNIERRDNDEKMELMLECNDVMLERINSNLDILAGIQKNAEPIIVEAKLPATPMTPKPKSDGSGGSWNDSRNSSFSSPFSKTAKLLTARNIIRPQINFKTPVDNSNNNPFMPQLKYKPHSIKPLAILPEYDEDGNIESYLHPYEFELSKFVPNENRLTNGTVTKPLKIEETPLTYVDTNAKLNTMVEELAKATEIAVDVEHHSYRTFQGITCLLQISTRTNDYIVDTLALREELVALNEVFTNPKILKVFHGADSDVEWLQRDLSVYIVNMFDTHQAAKRLGLARLSLAFLFKHYCQIDADKSLQLADWRMRPLPNELIDYARQDTHYLLYIYDLLRQELLNKANGKTNLLLNVYKSSTDVCMKRYVKLKITPDSHMELYRKSKRIFDNRQFFALKELFLWRDNIARMEDESYAYVLPNHMMLQIAENLPREMQGILACCNPIPPLVRQHLHVLHRFILQAREQPLTMIINEEQTLNRSTILSKNQEVNSHLYCPHDNPNIEFRDDLPTLLGNNGAKLEVSTLNQTIISRLKPKGPAVTVFHASNRRENRAIIKVAQIQFFSPYARYLAVLPFAEKERQAETARLAAESRKRKLCPDNSDDVIMIQNPSTSTSVPEEDIRVPLKNLEKAEKTTSTEQPPEKKRKIDPDLAACVESKLLEIRKEIAVLDKSKSNGETSSKKKNKKNRNNQQNSTVSQQKEAKPAEFDYASVDFQKFRGGSIKEQPNVQFKSKFHGKGKNNKANKQFFKSISVHAKKK